MSDFEYDFHPLANLLPLMDEDQFDGLVGSIRREGLLEPIVLFEGKILDGRNRYRAAREAHYKFSEKDFEQLKAGVDPQDFVYSANIQRRHLSSEQKRQLIRRYLKLNPEASNRAVAKFIGVDDKTVAKVRDEIAKAAKDFREAWDDLGEPEQRAFVLEYRQVIQGMLKGGAENPQQNRPAKSAA